MKATNLKRPPTFFIIFKGYVRVFFFLIFEEKKIVFRKITGYGHFFTPGRRTTVIVIVMWLINILIVVICIHINLFSVPNIV